MKVNIMDEDYRLYGFVCNECNRTTNADDMYECIVRLNRTYFKRN